MKPFVKLTKAQEKEILNIYDAGAFSAAVVADRYGVSLSAIYALLRDNGRGKQRGKERLDKMLTSLYDIYSTGNGTIADIAAFCGVSQATIRRAFLKLESRPLTKSK